MDSGPELGSQGVQSPSERLEVWLYWYASALLNVHRRSVSVGHRVQRGAPFEKGLEEE